jgi:uracil-DNA glycosylase/DNA polymerase I-like protein with 3'-5' exonuclease and polymerase domains
MSTVDHIAQQAACGKYDPRAYGAKCDQCYLMKMRQGGPVPPEFNPGAKVMIAAEAPGADEVEYGRPLIGASGKEMQSTLSSLGFQRGSASYSNAALCRPPGNDMDRLLLRLKKENTARIEQGLAPYLSPLEACRPRFINELRLFRDVITLGKQATSSITGRNTSIFDLRGMPIEGQLDGRGQLHTEFHIAKEGELVTPLRIMPTIHPAFVLRAKRWRRVFRVDLSRALRWFNGTLEWKVPTKIFQPRPDDLEYFLLRQPHKFMVYDLETDARECLVAKIRCIGVGTPEIGMVAGLLSIDGQTHLYPSDEEEAVVDIFIRFFTGPVIKAGWNVGYYDRIVVERQLGVTPAPVVDGILFHRAVESELPHNLGFVGSIHTDVMENWKADHTAVSAQTDQDLWEYNLTDCVVNARLIEPLYTVTQQRGLTNVVGIHHEIQSVCAGLHTTGMFVDQHRRRDHDIRLKTEAFKQRQTMRQILDAEEFNPNSRAQVGSILFDKWGLHPEVIYASDPSGGKKLKKAFTAGGDPSTGDDHLRAMLLHVKDDSNKVAFIKALRKFRGAVKIRGTNIIPLRPYDELYIDDDLAINLDTEEGAQAVDEYNPNKFASQLDGKSKARHANMDRAKKGKISKPGLTMADGRVHPHYNAHATTSQRLSSSEPNGQNWTRAIRDIVCATVTDWYEVDGGLYPREFKRALIAADMDQLELRFGAALAGAARYLEVFARNGDPHAVTCEMLYGTMFTNASEADKKRFRDFAKRFSYAVLYRATVETVHETLASSENDNGELVFPWLTLKETRVFYDKWIKANPEIEAWWDRDLTEFRQQGYLLEPVFGWRRDFLDGEDPNEIANFKCQAGGSAIVHIGTLDFLKHAPFARWGQGTGLIQQGHDALMVEVPAEHAPVEWEKDKRGKPKVKKWCAKRCKCVTAKHAEALQDSMTIKGSRFGLPVDFTATAKAALRWSEV